MASGRAFEESKTKQALLKNVSSLWKNSTRAAGFVMVGFGLMRGIEAFQVWESKRGKELEGDQ